ncbi:MAG: hypothetical protein WCP61_08545 [Chitinophagia bacterium]
MKKIIGLLSLLILSQVSFAQDFKKVQEILFLKKIEAAKTEYERVVSKKPALENTIEGIYAKAVINWEITRDSSLTKKFPNAFHIMHTAVDQYILLDTSLKVSKEYGQQPFIDIFYKSFKEGVAAFERKDWKNSASNFDTAVSYSDLIFTKGMSTNTKQKFDTTSLMYAGYAHQNAGNKESSTKYYKRLVDAKIQSKELLDVYRFLLIQYIDAKDKNNFDTYYKVSKNAYPTENWLEYKSDYIEKHYSMDEKIAAYNEMIADNTMTELACQMFGDMFMAGKNIEGITVEKSDDYLLKAQEAYKKTYTMNPNNFAAAFNVGISYYNQFSVLDDKYAENIRSLQTLNTNRPAASKDPKKKLIEDAKFKLQVDSVKKLNTALDMPILDKVNAAIEWIEKSYNNLKDKDKYTKTEKSVMSKTVDFLATLYSYKRDRARGKDQKAYDEFEAKYNLYDKLHEKFQ